jgi:L-lactate permease
MLEGFSAFVVALAILAVILIVLGVKRCRKAWNTRSNASAAIPKPCGPA